VAVAVRAAATHPVRLRTCDRTGGQDGEEGAGHHAGAERDAPQAGGALPGQQGNAVAGAEQEPGEHAGGQAGPAVPGRQGAQAGGELGVFTELEPIHAAAIYTSRHRG
jgi:hypothetical protein